MSGKQQFLDLGELPPVAPMRAVTVRQPWAWYIVRPDLFSDEARQAARAAGKIADGICLPWAPDERLKAGGRIWIHAAEDLNAREVREAADFLIDRGIFEAYELPDVLILETGGIVGWGTFDGIETQPASRWFSGGKFWRLAESRPCDFKKMAGKPGLFDIGRELERRAEHRREKTYQESKRREKP